MSVTNQTTKPWEIRGFLEVRNDRLCIDGISATELAGKYETPLFVFSEKRIRENVRRLLRAQSEIGCRLKVCYAAKANSNMGILRVIREAGSDIEVNSGGELFKALEVGFAPEQIIFNGTSKTEKELEEAVAAGIYAIQADSLYEIELAEKVARRLGRRANVSLRIVPEIKTDTMHGLQTALLTSKFGMLQGEAFEAFRRWRDAEFLNLHGIHLHLGSQNPSAEPYFEAFKTLFASLLDVYRETGNRLTHINLGGGFPVNYLRDTSQVKNFSKEQVDYFSASLEPAEVLRRAWEAVKESAAEAGASELLDGLTLLLEPGRSVIADAGVVLTAVRNHKNRPINSSQSGLLRNPHTALHTDSWLLTDAGFNIMLSMETYKWYYHLISASRAGLPHETPYKLAGPLCDGGDVYFDIEGGSRLPDYRLLPEGVSPGEILALLNVGAYSVAQMFPYNGRELPAIVLIKEDGTDELIRTRDTYADLLANEKW